MGLVVFLNNDNLVQLLGLVDVATGNYVNAATVTVTLIDNQGNVQQGPVTMGYIASSNGNYQGTLPASASLSVDTGYRASVTVSSGSSTANWYLPVVVQFRQS